MTDMESDQELYSCKQIPVSSKAVAFCCPKIEANLILNPVPEPDADNDSIATSAHGEYTTEGVPLEDQSEDGQSRSSKLFDIVDEDDYNSTQLPRIVMDKPPGDDLSPMTRTSSQPTMMQGGPPGAIVLQEMEGDASHRGRSASIPHRKSRESDDRERRKSQELGANNPSPTPPAIPTIQTTPSLIAPISTSMPPHRSSSESLLTQANALQRQNNQLSFLASQSTLATGSMTSLDDMDVMSIDSDSSEGFTAANMMRLSAGSSQGGLEVESESGIGKFRMLHCVLCMSVHW